MYGNVLITGGTGTLGQALVAALQLDAVASITVYSRSELLQAQMRQRFPDVHYILGDVRDAERLTAAVGGHQTVIHAAAMKRLPECEAQPSECYQTNVAGSANVIRACLAGGVDRCVAVSTDKACQAISAYGASKLMMEKLFTAASGRGDCCFTLCRYGNVVASRGSVIPLWRSQAERGEPLTLTDAGMTRFWMSEAQAVETVLNALAGVNGTILVPKLAALSVLDLAAILHPHHLVREIGLRSIEKRHEDLIHVDEPVVEFTNWFSIGHPGTTGNRYRSDLAPRLSADAFLDMLNQAELHEAQR